MIELNDKERAYLLRYCTDQAQNIRYVYALLRNGHSSQVLDDDSFIFWSQLAEKLM